MAGNQKTVETGVQRCGRAFVFAAQLWCFREPSAVQRRWALHTCGVGPFALCEVGAKLRENLRLFFARHGHKRSQPPKAEMLNGPG